MRTWERTGPVSINWSKGCSVPSDIMKNGGDLAGQTATGGD